MHRVQLTLTGLTAKLEGLVVCNIVNYLCDIKQKGMLLSSN